MTLYETRLRGARKRLQEASELAPNDHAREHIATALAALTAALATLHDADPGHLPPRHPLEPGS
jgi:hypothetical protein